MSISPLVTCADCSQRCDDKSLNNYQFINDVERSEAVEQQILEHINFRGGGQIICRKSTQPGYPDLEIALSSSPASVKLRLEVKYQARAFMKVADKLPDARLKAWETIALNLSDLERYISIHEKDNIPIHLVWRVERYCLGTIFLFQDVTVLSNILDKYKTKRRWKRASGNGDVSDDGVHRGVVVNYHFSVQELISFHEYLNVLKSLS